MNHPRRQYRLKDSPQETAIIHSASVGQAEGVSSKSANTCELAELHCVRPGVCHGRTRIAAASVLVTVALDHPAAGGGRTRS